MKANVIHSRSEALRLVISLSFLTGPHFRPLLRAEPVEQPTEVSTFDNESGSPQGFVLCLSAFICGAFHSRDRR
jgi:hypothetical protein